MSVTHLIRESISTSDHGLYLNGDVVFCGARIPTNPTDDDDRWSTVWYMMNDPDGFRKFYSHYPTCPTCMNHPDVALEMLGEV